MRLRSTLPLALSSLLLWSSVARHAHADARACIAKNEEGSVLRARGEYATARLAYLACGVEACPEVIREECQSLVGALDAVTPTVLLVARDGRGNDVLGVRVIIDGREHGAGVDGRAIPLNPGEHTFRFEGAGLAREARAVLREGEKNRPIQVELGEPSGAEPEPASSRATRRTEAARPVPALAYVLTATSAIALGSFGYFALRGRAQQSDLEERCAPDCRPEEAQAMRNKYLAADVSLALVALSLGGATYVYLSRPTEAPPSTALRPPALLGDGLQLQLTGKF